MNENEISDSFDLMPNSIFDNILFDTNSNFSMNDIWNDDVLTKHSFEDIPLLAEFESKVIIDENENEFEVDPIKTQSNNSQILHHDCMWSGTCTDLAHKTKKKYRFSHIDEIIADHKEDIIPQEFAKSNDIIETVPLVEPNEEITKLMNDFDRAFNCLHKVEKPASNPTIKSQNISPSIPPPLQYFVPIQTFGKAQSTFLPKYQKLSCKPSIEHFTKSNSQIQLNVNVLKQNENARNNNEQFLSETPSFSSEESIQITPYYPETKLEPSNVSSSSLLFYNNNLYTIDQLNNINFMDLQYSANDPCTSQRKLSAASLPKCYNEIDVDMKNKQTKRVKIMNKKIKKSNVNKCRNMTKKKVKSKVPNPFSIQNKYFFQFGEDEPIMKRNMHNCMERQRRIGLKNLFIELKQSIPELQTVDRVPKIAILREAANYCQELTNEANEFIELKKKNASLVKKYKRLLRKKFSNKI